MAPAPRPAGIVGSVRLVHCPSANDQRSFQVELVPFNAAGPEPPTITTALREGSNAISAPARAGGSVPQFCVGTSAGPQYSLQLPARKSHVTFEAAPRLPEPASPPPKATNSPSAGS